MKKIRTILGILSLCVLAGCQGSGHRPEGATDYQMAPLSWSGIAEWDKEVGAGGPQFSLPKHATVH